MAKHPSWPSECHDINLTLIEYTLTVECSIHYAYGNIHLAQKEWLLSRKAYNRCLGISNAKTSVHPITVAGYYRLGCVEFELGHQDLSL